jgi:hypothetical protein
VFELQRQQECAPSAAADAAAAGGKSTSRLLHHNFSVNADARLDTPFKPSAGQECSGIKSSAQQRTSEFRLVFMQNFGTRNKG